jgi:hypothetical protein
MVHQAFASIFFLGHWDRQTEIVSSWAPVGAKNVNVPESLLYYLLGGREKKNTLANFACTRSYC